MSCSCHFSEETSQRFFTALYNKMEDPALRTSNKQGIFLNLLFRCMRKDVEQNRVKVSQNLETITVNLNTRRFPERIIRNADFVLSRKRMMISSFVIHPVQIYMLFLTVLLLCISGIYQAIATDLPLSRRTICVRCSFTVIRGIDIQ